MNAERFNWKEIAQLVGGIAIIALIQVGLLFPDTHDFVGSWLATTSTFERRRRSSTKD
jgi:hypothetical protein